MRRMLFIALALAKFLVWPAYAEESNMKIKIILKDGPVILGTLENNETAKDFAALLPLTLTLEDYNGTEKISHLPRTLTKKGAPVAITPKVGDITLYGPWGNLAIFYRNGHNSPGLIKLGEIDSGGEAFNGSGSLNVKIEMVK